MEFTYSPYFPVNVLEGSLGQFPRFISFGVLLPLPVLVTRKIRVLDSPRKPNHSQILREQRQDDTLSSEIIADFNVRRWKSSHPAPRASDLHLSSIIHHPSSEVFGEQRRSSCFFRALVRGVTPRFLVIL